MWGRRQSMRSEQGITLIEVMVAAVILLIGMGGVLTLVDGANRAAGATNSRVTALNLGREVFEAARAVEYDSLTPASVAAALQAKPGLAGTGNPWTVTRRGVSYAVKVRACTFDDPKDGLANGSTVTVPDNECLPRAGAATGAPAEANPDDFRRVDVTVSWTFRGAPKSLLLTDSIVNPSGGLGPRIRSITQPAAQITGGTSVTIPVTTTPNATTLHWIVDSIAAEGDAAGGPASWTINWPIGSVGSAAAVLDGTYTLNAQPFDTRGVPGDTRSAIVQLNRSLPIAPTGLVGGRNEAHGQTVVDLEWDGNPERDILGYRVYRTDGTGTRLVCGQVSRPLNALSCTDDPMNSSGTVTYRVYAIDRADLADAGSALREGAASNVLTSTGAGPRPDQPTGLAATVQNNLAHLTWTAPASGSVAFYRIYRDGVRIADRVARTASSATLFDDVTWGGTGHTYRVAAVGPSYNESALSDPVALASS